MSDWRIVRSRVPGNRVLPPVWTDQGKAFSTLQNPAQQKWNSQRIKSIYTCHDIAATVHGFGAEQKHRWTT